MSDEPLLLWISHLVSLVFPPLDDAAHPVVLIADYVQVIDFRSEVCHRASVRECLVCEAVSRHVERVCAALFGPVVLDRHRRPVALGLGGESDAFLLLVNQTFYIPLQATDLSQLHVRLPLTLDDIELPYCVE